MKVREDDMQETQVLVSELEVAKEASLERVRDQVKRALARGTRAIVVAACSERLNRELEAASRTNEDFKRERLTS